MNNEEYLNFMKTKHPKVFKNIHYLECDEGWQNLIRELAFVIENELQHISDADSVIAEEMYAVQIKEKFGGLRFYMSHTTPRIDGAIQLAEVMSYNICEVCGINDTVSKRSYGGYIRSCCDKCHETNLLNKENR